MPSKIVATPGYVLAMILSRGVFRGGEVVFGGQTPF